MPIANRNIKTRLIPLFGIFCLFFYSSALAQETDSLSLSQPMSISKGDTLNKPDIRSTDSLATDINEIENSGGSGLDSAVIYSSKKIVRFNFRDMLLHLQGDSKLDYKEQKLEAELITIDLTKKTLDARGDRDSNDRLIGVPKFVDAGESFVGERILFNFLTSKGTISLGETEITDGFYFGSKIKKISENEAFIKDGKFTTCDDPHPHFYFGSEKMKVVTNDKVFADDMYFYVEDIPIFWLPIGVYFPSQSGRRSGLIIPTFFFSKDRGVVIQDFGIFLALSDYYDTQLNIDVFTKGGYTFKNFWRWNVRDQFSGNLNLEFGKTRNDPDDDYVQNFRLDLKHNHNLTPNSRFDANLSFMSSDFYTQTSTNQYDRQQQNITSNASYNTNFDNGNSFALGYRRNQNLFTEEINQTADMSFNLPQMKPLKNAISPQSSVSWLRDITFKYGVSASYATDNNPYADSSYVGEDQPYDSFTSFDDKYRAKIQHTPSISISPKLGYFNISPSLNFGANTYFRKMTRDFNPDDSSLVDTYEQGMFWEYRMNASLGISTRMYGMSKARDNFLTGWMKSLFDVDATRHILQPTFSYSYTPDQSDPSKGFYGDYINASGDTIKYSRYEADGGGIASRSESQSLSFSLKQTFESKINQGDSLDATNLKWMQWDMNGSFNMAADSLKFSDIRMSFRIPDLKDLTFNADASFTLYDEEQYFDEETGEYSGAYHKVNRYLVSNGGGLMRLTSLSLNFSKTFSSSTTGSSSTSASESYATDSLDLGDRFAERNECDTDYHDYYADNTPGYTRFHIPWEFRTGLRFVYNEYTLKNISRTLTLSIGGSFNLTPTWRINANADYDFVNNEVLSPNINISKDLHCWLLSFNWYPTGPSAGFHLKFNIKAPLLQDLKFEKRNSPIY
jgi:lipopolysaccharide transport LptD-like protein